MTRTKGNIHALFRAIHKNRDILQLPDAWRRGVMDDILRKEWADDALLRLAPRFTLAAAALSLIGLAAGSLTLPQLASAMGSSYAPMIYDLATSAWTLM